MMTTRLFALAAGTLLSFGAVAQTYPAKPVRLIVGFAPGGGTDVVARVIGQKPSEWYGQCTVTMNFDTMPPVIDHIKSGRLRALAVSTPRRVGQLPDVATFTEEGMSGFDVTNWYGVMAPAGTPREIVNKLNADINKAMQVPEVRARLEQVGTQMREGSAADFEAFQKAEVAKYAKLVRDAGIAPE